MSYDLAILNGEIVTPRGRYLNDVQTGWDGAATGPTTVTPPYRLGEDVVHPTFGEGVVTGVEPGGIVVIRFSKDRTERKLVADLAPISKR